MNIAEQMMEVHTFQFIAKNLFLTIVKFGAPTGALVLAEEQTQGRGTKGRSWNAMAAKNLLVSICLRPKNAAELAKINFALALSAVDICNNLYSALLL